MLEVISVAGRWITAELLYRRLGGRCAAHPAIASLTELLDRLTALSLLRRSDLPPALADIHMEKWRDWNPSAGFFHTATKDVVFIEDDGFAWAPPESGTPGATPAAQPQASLPLDDVQLSVPAFRGGLSGVLRDRRTWRRFSAAPVTATDVSTILWWTGGIQGWLIRPDGHRAALKTSPSAGACHPVNLYLLVRNIKGIRPGLYGYDAERHRLVGIAGQEPADIREYLPRQHWYQNSALVLFFCARFERTMSRYRFARAYRAIAVEAGHLAQTFCLVATSLGLAPFTTMALAEDAIDRALRLDGINESVLYAAGAGRPAASGPPSAPAGLKGVRLRPRRLTR